MHLLQRPQGTYSHGRKDASARKHAQFRALQTQTVATIGTSSDVPHVSVHLQSTTSRQGVSTVTLRQSIRTMLSNVSKKRSRCQVATLTVQGGECTESQPQIEAGLGTTRESSVQYHATVQDSLDLSKLWHLGEAGNEIASRTTRRRTVHVQVLQPHRHQLCQSTTGEQFSLSTCRCFPD